MTNEKPDDVSNFHCFAFQEKCLAGSDGILWLFRWKVIRDIRHSGGYTNVSGKEKMIELNEMESENPTRPQQGVSGYRV
jgi:hypothetical protein